MNALIKYLLVVALGFGGYYAWGLSQALPPLTSKTQVLVYGPSEGTQLILELLHMKGLSARLVPVNTWEEVLSIGIKRLQDAGIVSGGNASLPFYSVDGKLVTQEKFTKAIENIPAGDLRESPAPYVVVYGLEGCGFTLSGRRKLDDNNIPYEFRDVNESRNQPHFQALMQISKITTITWPVMDISGHILVNPSIEDIMKYYAGTNR